MKQNEKICPVIVNEIDNVVYISDPDTYEIIYLNRAMKKTLGMRENEEYRGKLCYELLQGLDAPCPFCTNASLCKDKYYTWKHYNEKLGRYFSLKDKLVEVDGHLFRMEICTDVTESELRYRSLELQLSIEETLVQCVHALSESQNLDETMNGLLKIIGDFYQAERSYIFECDYTTDSLINLYEWCKEGIEPQIENLQDVPIEVTAQWIEHFNIEGYFYIKSLSGRCEGKEPDQEILEMQGIENLMAAPIWKQSEQWEEGPRKLAGFVGVDNPTRGMEHIKLLQSVAYFIYNNLERHRMFSKLHEMSRTDELTGLGNRNDYIHKLDELRERKLRSLGVIFMDINGLKYANDHFGHGYGDNMIRSVAQGIHRIFPGDGYRIGGDEFVVLFADSSRDEFERHLNAMKSYAQEECICDFSMGVNFSGMDVNVDELVAHSDEMMYTEKQLYYGNASEDKPVSHRAVSKRLVRDLEKKNFEIFLQPKIQLDSGEVVGAEALMRRKGENGEYILPEHFIPLYEKEGIIQLLDCYAFEEVCSMLRMWMDTGGKPVPISVNFSRISLISDGIIERLADIRSRYKIPPKLLILEITESISRMEPTALKELMNKLHEYEFVVSLDDYGYQYSNLAVLANMDFVELKLDRSLVEEIANNPKARIVIENSIEMCRQLNKVMSTAEGIESEEQLELLKQFNCNVGQGFFFSKPLPKELFIKNFGTKTVELK